METKTNQINTQPEKHQAGQLNPLTVQFKKNYSRDFPGGPVIKTPCSKGREGRQSLIPGQEN